jgi:hypothetical protein
LLKLEKGNINAIHEYGEEEEFVRILKYLEDG